jgi:hypothetical protein
MDYESTVRCTSAVARDVSFTVVRMSFGRRLALVRELREIAARAEYHRAGSASGDTVEAALLDAEADRIYLRWGLAGVDGLEIDGAPATPESIFTVGPEALCREIVQRVKQECFLTADERKN